MPWPAGSKNQTNPLKRRDRLVWFFIHFRGPKALDDTLDVGRELYNLCLHQRKLHPLSRYEQSKQLTQLKAEFPVYKNVYSQVLQNVLDRVDQAFKSFFRSGFGFPRFKGANRFDSFTYPQTGFCLGGGQLSLAKIGNVKLRLSRGCTS
jgi:putative transposase